MWTVRTRPTEWPNVGALTPETILDDYDGPRLFTLRSADGYLLLAYQCAQDDDTERYLIVPADDALVHAIDTSKVTLRDALTGRGWAWLIDRHLDGSIFNAGVVDPKVLPPSALPKVGVRIRPAKEPLLRLKMVGESLDADQVPASVVRRAVDGATGAIRILVRHALRMRPGMGRPTESFRRFYDLPAIGFSFGSFEVEFGTPVLDSQLSLESDETFRTVHDLLSTGLEWAADAAQKELQHDTAWSAIIEALAQLAPPPKGPIDRVDVSGALAGHPRVTYPLTRSSSDRIGNERKRLPIDRRKRTREGFVREFDKDRLTFILRTARGDTIRSVSFSEEQYGDVWLAFDAERPVTIVMEELPDTQVADLVSITLMASDEQQHEGHEDASTGSSS
jgi:hypothetical protein